MQPGRELTVREPSEPVNHDPRDGDPATALLRVVRQGVAALVQPDADPTRVASSLVSALRRTPGVADVWISAGRRVVIHLRPGVGSELVEEAVQAVVGLLEAALRMSAEGYPGSWQLAGVDPAAHATAMHAVVDNSSMVIVSVRPDGSQWSASAAFTKLLGHPRDPQPRSRLFEIVHPDDRPDLVEAISRIRDGAGTSGPLDLRVRTADGRWLVLQTRLCDLTWHPDVNAVIAYATDVTGERELTRRLDVEHARVSELVATMHAGILAEDEQGVVVLANAEFVRIFGYPGPVASLHGRTRAAVFDAVRSRFEAPGETVRALRRLATAGTVDANQELTLADGRVLELDFVPIVRAEGRMGALWQFRDVTERVRSQRALEQHNEALVSVAEAKNEFVGTVSHEMRTPLTSVVSFTRLLTEAGELNSEQHDFLVVIERNVNRLLRLIDDLLTLVRFEARQHQLKLDRVDLADLLQTAASEWRPKAARAGIRLDSDVAPGPEIAADEVRLRQVVDNLVGNAIKFTDRGGTVTVRGIPHSGGWRVEISDTGIGIPEADLPRMFQTFARASNAVERSVPGTGLGLVIARTIAELHGGTIGATSAEGAGTTITVCLPTDPAVDPSTP
ncbi:MAG TPA: PAS domain-containing sensor histidine kinase [Micromonosporaceae bacterium]|jgi:PAS domain S-box-containing protein|nr:PAS domain-containing sensor histidine kinase [Micromonosporaceae bacterium]